MGYKYFIHEVMSTLCFSSRSFNACSNAMQYHTNIIFFQNEEGKIRICQYLAKLPVKYISQTGSLTLLIY